MPTIDMSIVGDNLLSSLLALDRVGTARLLGQLTSAYSPPEIVDRVIVPALEELGRRWDLGQVALAQVYMSTRICEESIDEMLLPGGSVRFRRPRMAIAVLHDHHMLGKRIVASILRSAGHEVRDYGRQTAVELASRAVEDGVEILLVSVLMLNSALRVKELRERLDASVCTAIAKAGRGGGFILSDNHGEIPWQVPEEVLSTISETVHRDGRYPLAQGLGDA